MAGCDKGVDVWTADQSDRADNMAFPQIVDLIRTAISPTRGRSIGPLRVPHPNGAGHFVWERALFISPSRDREHGVRTRDETRPAFGYAVRPQVLVFSCVTGGLPHFAGQSFAFGKCRAAMASKLSQEAGSAICQHCLGKYLGGAGSAHATGAGVHHRT